MAKQTLEQKAEMLFQKIISCNLDSMQGQKTVLDAIKSGLKGQDRDTCHAIAEELTTQLNLVENFGRSAANVKHECASRAHNIAMNCRGGIE